MFKNLLIPKTITFAFIIPKAWEVEGKCYLEKSKIPAVNINQIKAQSVLMVITFMSNFFKLTLLTLKFTQSDHIICMPRPEDHLLWMVSWIEIKVVKKKDSLSFLLLKKSFSVLKSSSNFSKISADSIFSEPRENPMYVM